MTTYADTPAYTPHKPKPRVSSEELRARIPGWGADLDPADRPSVPREQFDENLSGARWEYPDVQPETWPRERSIEHAGLTPVFGTAQPPRGVSGAIRKLAYARYSEGRAAHWLLLILADRVNTLGSTLGSFASLHPDNLITETGILSEFKVNGWKSRVGQGRADIKHHPLDPLIVAGPWVLGGWLGYRVLRRLRRTA